MNIYAALSDQTLIIIIILIVVFVLAILSIFIFIFVRKRNYRKEVRKLEGKFQKAHILLLTQCSNYVRRLEVISHSNLLYGDKHRKYLMKFKDIRDKYDTKAQNAINNIKDLATENNYKKLKIDLPQARNIITEFETEVNELNSNLLKEIKPEDDARQKALLLQENYRRIKNEYDLHNNELTLVSESYEKIFKLVDDKFSEFNNCIESAQYDEANEILPKIDKILHQLSSIGRELPKLVALVNTIIPDKIASLQNAYEVMIQDNYPLHHLTVNVNIREMNDRLELLKNKIRIFDINGVQDQLDKISASIDDFFVLFDEEKKAREQFENDNSGIYQSVNDIERRFIKLKNKIPEVSKIFIINNEYNAKITEIQTEINKVGAFKRSLDTLVHSSVKQPFSVLYSKMNDLHKETDLVISEIESFMAYLESLKRDSEIAYQKIYEYFALLKNAENDLRQINNEFIYSKYKPTIDHLFDLISQVNDLLKVTPIDVEKVNANIEQIHNEGDSLLGANGEISQEAKMRILAENAIVYANRSRNKLSDVDDLIKQSEQLFIKGKFEDSYQVATSVLKRIQTMSDEN
ncbi:MAG: septation ring formation regulator EzrA [Bacillales bacterium]|nr:septation ring formation regulator EzrA [Bacillales bacterium]MDY6003683.1 septation ring formation regulator EzrA [Bacilli bacterium]